MKKVLFVGSFPNEVNIKDGMIRRVKEIEMKFVDYKKSYLDMTYRRTILKKIFKIKKVTVFLINKLLKTLYLDNILSNENNLYIHSLYNYALLHRYIKKNKIKKNIIVDFHGIVPEELVLNNDLRAKKFFRIEAEMMKNINKAIFVTKVMENFYKEKYPEEMKKIKTLVYPIIDGNTSFKEKIEIEEIPKNKVVVLYSGNFQKWQNIELMMETIQKLNCEDIFYIFLTSQKDEAKDVFKKYKIKENSYLIDSVKPSQLWKYYEVANYGFILRDNIDVNKVANPTKLGEYLEYGIIPIVKLEEIGDYKEMGYEYITLEKFNGNLPKIKSEKNIKIMKEYRKKIEEIDFIKFIES